MIVPEALNDAIPVLSIRTKFLLLITFNTLATSPSLNLILDPPLTFPGILLTIRSVTTPTAPALTGSKSIALSDATPTTWNPWRPLTSVFVLKISITSPLLKSWFGWIIPVISVSPVFWKVTSSNWTLVLCKSVTLLPLMKYPYLQVELTLELIKLRLIEMISFEIQYHWHSVHMILNKVF